MSRLLDKAVEPVAPGMADRRAAARSALCVVNNGT